MSLWLAALLLTASPTRASGGGVDLSDQFPASCRNQGWTDACHSFAAIALLEAAIKHRYHKEIELSDADLFVRSGFLKRHQMPEFLTKESGFELDEGGCPDCDLNVALSSGVAYRKTAPWEKFKAAYSAYLREIDAKCVGFEKEGIVCRIIDLKQTVDDLNLEDAERERRLLGDPKALKRDRLEVKSLLTGLLPKVENFDKSTPESVADKGVCLEKGLKQTESLVRRLSESRPVIAVFKIDNLPGWDDDMKRIDGGSHGAVVYAYETIGEGSAARHVFKLRNSWGERYSHPFPVNLLMTTTEPNTFDIDEDHACAIVQLIWLEP